MHYPLFDDDDGTAPYLSVKPGRALPLLAAGALLLPAPAAAAVPRVRAAGWTATLVNQERIRSRDGGSLRRCRAIAPTVLAVRLRYAGARRGTHLRLRLAVPGHGARGSRLRLTARRGRIVRAWTPRGLRLTAEAFPAGRYRLRVSSGGRVLARASVRLADAGTC